VCLGLSSVGAQPIEVSGAIASDTTWGPDLTYKVTGDLTVAAGVTLTILSGCSVEFSSESSDLIVNGRLDVQGSAASPVTFREFTGTPRWGGIYINATGDAGDSSLNYAVIENGGSNYFSSTSDSMLWIKDASPTLQHCTFQGGRYDAIHLENSEATISDCLFMNNSDDAIEMDLNSSPHWSGNSASGNALDGIRVLYGNLRKDRTWRPSALPYVLEPDVVIDASYELTIEPGTMVQGYSSSADLVVQGTLTALGTEALPIVFTSLGDSDAAVWGGIYFGPAAGASRLQYCQVRYGGSNYFSSTGNSMLRCQGSSPALVHCTLAHSKLYGLSLLASEATLEQVHFADNIYAAGYMDTASFPTFTVISATRNEYDAIEINGGSVSASGRWDYCEIPYLLQEDVTVAAGVTLLIDPDSEIQFKASSADLIVQGTLLALGQAATPIRFTSARRAATPGAWGGLVFSGTASNASQLQHCEISYGGSNYFSTAGVSSLRIQNASPSISDCRISSSLTDGINLYGSDATLERCLLSGCAGHAIRMDVASFPSFDGNEATGNGYNVITIRPGTLSQSGRWDLADLAYNLEEDVIVPEGVHLAIDAGNVIRFQANFADLVIQGSLEALGTTSANILFTPLSRRSPGAFGGLYFGPTVNGARTRLSYCVFEYGGSNYFSWAQGAMVYCEGCSPTFSSCSFENSLTDGLRIRGGVPTFTQATFRNSGGDAIEIFSNTFPLLNDTVATGNKANAVRITGDQWTGGGQWVRAGVPYRIGEDVVIQASGEVRVEAGTTLEFESNYSDLYVAGRLDCVGSGAQPIRFTSSRTSPAQGSWGALTFAGGAKGQLDYVTLEFGGSGYFSSGDGSALRIMAGADVSVSNVTQRDSLYHGMILEGQGVSALNSSFSGNGESAVLVRGTADVQLTGCRLADSNRGLHLQETAVGTVSGSSFDTNGEALTTEGDSARIFFGGNQFSGNTRTGSVNFLTAASSQPGNLIYGDAEGLRISSGNLSENGTLHPLQGGYYEIRGRRSITPTGSLQVRPGTYLALEGWDASLQVAGYLGVNGLTAQPVLIAAPPNIPSATARNLYDGICFIEDATGVIRHAVIRNAGAADWSGPWAGVAAAGNSSVSVEHCRFDSNTHALEVRDTATLYAAYCQFVKNAVALDTNGSAGMNATTKFSQIASNDTGVRNQTTSIDVDATFNWWGDASGPGGSGPGSGDSVTAGVIYTPWFTSTEQVPDQPLSPQLITLSTIYSETISSYSLKLYRVVVEAGRNLLCRLADDNVAHLYHVFASYDYQPTPAHFDVVQRGPGYSGDHELVIPDTRAGDYYILVFATQLASDPGAYELELTYVDHHFAALSPVEAGNKGPVTLSLSGAGFTADTGVRLLAGDGTPYAAESVRLVDSSNLHATIDLQGAVVGTYDLELSWPSAGVETSPNAFQVTPGIGGRLEVALSLPGTIVWYRPYTMTLSYRNTGDSDMVAPIIKVVTLYDDSGISLTPGGPYKYSAGDSLQVLGVASDGPAGVLRPGGSGQIPIYYRSNGAHGRVEFNLETLRDPAAAVDWDAVEQDVRPPDVTGWATAWQAYTSSVGPTWGDYQARLAAVATEFWQEGALVYDVEQLFARSLNIVRSRASAELRGTVVDNQSGHPQANVVVLLTEPVDASQEPGVAKALSDSEGRYQFSHLPPGTYDVEVVGYPSVSPAQVTLAENEILSDVLLQVPYGGAMEGTVRDNAGKQPMAGVAVVLKSEQAKARVTLTDDTGQYRFAALEAGLYSIQAASPSFATRQYTGLQIWPGQVMREVDFLLDEEKTITGGVSDSQSASAIEGAVVAAKSADGLTFTARTSATGAYTLGQLSKGTYTLVCAAEGYRLSDETVVSVGDGASPTLDFALEPGYTRTGAVVEAGSAQGLSGAIVVCRNLVDDTVASATTDAGGAFTLSGLSEGLHYVYAAAAGHARVGRVVEVSAPSGPSIDLALPPTVSISGSVQDNDGGVPSEESYVVLENAEGAFLASTFTENGAFSFEFIPQGQVSLSVFNPGLSFPVAVLDLSGDVTGLAIEAAAGGIAGTVQDGGSQAIAGALVAAYPVGAGASERQARFTEADANGDYSLVSLLAGDYLLVAATDSACGRASQQVTVGTTAITQNLTLGAAAVVRGEVTTTLYEAPENKVEGAMIWMVPQGSPDGDPGQGGVSSATGDFMIRGLAAGTYTVYALAEGHVLYTQPGLSVAAGDSNPAVAIELDASGQVVSGRVQEAADALPLPGASVVFLTNGMEASRVVADSSGIYRSETLAPGDYEVEVQFKEYSSRTTVTVASASDAQNENFTLGFSPLAGLGGWEEPASKPGAAVGAGLAELSGWFSTRDVPRDPREATLRAIDWDTLSASGDCQPEAMGVVSELDSALLAYWNAQDALENASWSKVRETAAIVNQSLVVAGKVAEVVLAFKAAAIQALAALAEARETFSDVNSIVGDLNLLYGALCDYDAIASSKTTWESFVNHLKLIDKAVGKFLDNVQEWKMWGKFGRLAGPIYKIKDIALEAWNLVDEYNQATSTIKATGDAYVRAYYGYRLNIARAWAAYLEYRRCSGDTGGTPNPDTGVSGGGGSQVNFSVDPNEKTGPGGERAEVGAREQLTYTIFFENLETASAAAQYVRVEDYLDTERLDLNTFELQDVAFGDRTVAIAPGQTDYYQKVTFGDYAVDVEARLNPFTGLARWELTMIDPETGAMPLEGGIGFLPPNNPAVGDGEGHVTFSIQPKAALAPGTVIENEAEIVFDANESIWTNTTQHTIEVPGPDQPVNQLPADGATTSVMPTLAASAYSHPATPEFLEHIGSQFEVRDHALGTLVWDSGVRAATTEIRVPTGALQLDKAYKWHVRYQCEPVVQGVEKWSEWSEYTSFETAVVVALPPDRPSNVSPATGALDVALDTWLVASAYSHPASGFPHTGSEFEVWNFALDTLVWNSGVLPATNTVQVYLEILWPDTRYQWHARYQTVDDTWSEWSPLTWFETTWRWPWSKEGDFDGDDEVNQVDLLTLMKNWHTMGLGDMDGDGDVDHADLMLFSRHWHQP